MLVISMNCPICRLPLHKERDNLWLCPHGHGSLITVQLLQDIEQKTIPENAGVVAVQHEVISCPRCGATMKVTNYNATGILIDACMSCHARWLDSGEGAKIKNFKPAFTSEDLLFLLDVDLKMRKYDEDGAEANPNMPNTWNYMRGLRPTAGLGGIVGGGMYGLVKGLMHSKHSRILIIVTLIIFGMLFWLVALDAISFNT